MPQDDHRKHPEAGEEEEKEERGEIEMPSISVALPVE
jgi:sortase (surface protein transpeptidase)